MLNEAPAVAVINETVRVLREAMREGVADNVIPPAMGDKLDNSVFLFSGFKTAQELKEASLLLQRPDGTVKAFSEFYTDVRRVDATYNVHYLEAEYQFAINSSQMAARWADVETDESTFNLQYRTAGDDHVRPTHRALNGITLPPDDAFWDKYFGVNDWGCRCTVVKVPTGKYPASDPDEAMKLGDKATEKPRQKIFRFNPGKSGQLFPAKHPYYKLAQGEAKEVHRAVKAITETKRVDLGELIPGGGANYEHIKTVMTEYARLFPEDYHGGLNKIDLSRGGGAFMSNGRYVNRPGNILTVHNHNFKFISGESVVQFNPAKEVRDALTAIKKGEALTFNQEYAMESLWHETLHAKAKGWANRALRTDMTVMQMETVNQFVARHTYPQFIARLGGTAAQQAEVLERGYGYGNYVGNFRAMLQKFGIDEAETVEALRDKLLTEPYEKVGDNAIEFLKRKGVKNADMLMRSLHKSRDTFNRLFDLDLNP